MGAVLGTALAGSAVLVPVMGDRHERVAAQEIVLGESKDAVPSDTASDWVSYGDQSAVVHVAAEHEEGATSEEITAGEGYLPRTIDLQVTERVWARSGAPALPDTFTVVADGWELKDGSKIPVGSQDASRLEVGHDYLVSFAHFEDGQWATLGGGGILPYDNDQVGQGEFQGQAVSATAYRATQQERLVADAEQPLAYLAAGKAASAVKSYLQAATPDVTAAANWNLNAVLRARLVAKAAAAAAAAADTFCRVAAPLAVEAESHYTPDELADALTDLAGMTDTGALPLRVYALQLQANSDATTWKGRAGAAALITRECSIDVGDLLPTDVA